MDINTYILLFANIAKNINDNIDYTEKFKVYTVSQSLLNFNKSNMKFEKGDIITYNIFKSTTFTTNYPDYVRFISTDIFPLVFEINIDPKSLSKYEYYIVNSDQFEVILTPGCNLIITEVTRCYTHFKEGKIEIKQNCMHIKCDLLSFTDEYTTKQFALPTYE